ncbi:MAG TPA: hypothetical protein VE546_22545 [Streptomyces sp.]|uniref:hypothetical protein n=1 Tax=Streptomyces sp. TaxID=1931 RepID=UPI002D41C493|nr:hypothetical protein [Streptomyces sp.]HZG06318.1 hypothetical protein [Streptomyces sp.]
MNIQDSLENLINALRRHAELMSTPDAAGNAGVEAFLELRKAAAAYGRSVREETQWDSPFAEIEEDEEDLEADEEEDLGDIFGAEPGEDGFTVSGTWTFEVTDQEAWLEYVRQRLAGAPEAPRQLSGDPAEAAAAVLAYGDLFAPLAEHGVIHVDQDWTIQGAGEIPED